MIDDAQLETLQHRLLGTCDSLCPVLEELKIDASIEEAEDRLLDGNSIEKCSVCEWWFPSCVLLADHSPPTCEDCEDNA